MSSKFSEGHFKCKICNRPEVEQIDTDMITGLLSQQQIADKYGGLLQNNVSNHKSHLRPNAYQLMTEGDKVGVIATPEPEEVTNVTPSEAMQYYSQQIRRLKSKGIKNLSPVEQAQLDNFHQQLLKWKPTEDSGKDNIDWIELHNFLNEEKDGIDAHLRHIREQARDVGMEGELLALLAKIQDTYVRKMAARPVLGNVAGREPN